MDCVLHQELEHKTRTGDVYHKGIPPQLDKKIELKKMWPNLLSPNYNNKWNEVCLQKKSSEERCWTMDSLGHCSTRPLQLMFE